MHQTAESIAIYTVACRPTLSGNSWTINHTYHVINYINVCVVVGTTDNIRDPVRLDRNTIGTEYKRSVLSGLDQVSEGTSFLGDTSLSLSLKIIPFDKY